MVNAPVQYVMIVLDRPNASTRVKKRVFGQKTSPKSLAWQRRIQMNEKGSATMVKCFCPVCETYHKKRLFWTGRGTPRIICDPCKMSNEFDDPSEYNVNDRAIEEKFSRRAA